MINRFLLMTSAILGSLFVSNAFALATKMVNKNLKRFLISASLFPTLLFLAPSFALNYSWVFSITGQKNGQSVPLQVSNFQGSGKIISPQNPTQVLGFFDGGRRGAGNSFRVSDLSNDNYCDISLIYRTVISPQTTVNAQCVGAIQYSGERYLAPDKNCGSGIQNACFTLNFSIPLNKK